MNKTVDTSLLAKHIVLGLFQGMANTYEARLILRNKALSLYFPGIKATIMTKDSIGYNVPDEEAYEAHTWYKGLMDAVRNAGPSFEDETRAAECYLDRRPHTRRRKSTSNKIAKN